VTGATESNFDGKLPVLVLLKRTKNVRSMTVLCTKNSDYIY